ncbi:MAG: O-methyltransferase-like protein [Bacteroidetes bacterium]|nr:O-methyltransferase-like protein [Bacteroidota bacterium]
MSHFFSAKRKGHAVHSPFAYKLCEEVFYNTNSFYDFETLKEVRLSLARNKTELVIGDFGAGSKTFKGNKRKVSDIASKGISSSLQSELLYKLINYLRPATIIELGTSLGLNTLYLSMANSRAKVYSIEGSESLFEFATSLSAKNKLTNCEIIHGKFDAVLPGLLNKINSLDLFYVDGNHTYEATLNYFNMALEKRNTDSVFIFDDIYWSEGMTRAWNDISNNAKVTLSIDAFYFGLVFFKTEVKEKVHLKILV